MKLKEITWDTAAVNRCNPYNFKLIMLKSLLCFNSRTFFSLLFGLHLKLVKQLGNSF